MENRDICIMRFDTATKTFRVSGLSVFHFSIIPRIGEKIVFDDEKGAIIAEVIDVHYSQDGDADVYIGKEQPYVEYKLALDRNYLDTLDRSNAI